MFRLTSCLAVVVVFGVGQVNAESLTFDFDSGPGPNFSVFDITNGLFSVDTDGPTLRVSKPADDGTLRPNQFISAGIISGFSVEGNFTMTVDFTLHDFPATGQDQLNESLFGAVPLSGGNFALLRFRAGDLNMIETFMSPPGTVIAGTESSLASGRYRIERSGSTVTGSYASSGSSAFTPIGSYGGLSEPMRVKLWAGQGMNPAPAGRSTTALDISFDNLSIQADHITGVIPEPSTLILLATAALGLLACGWRKRRS